LWLNQCEYIIN